MSKFAQYNVVLKDLNDEIRSFEYELNDEYFKKIDSPEVQKGNVIAKVSVQAKQNLFELQFILDGTILIPCDRCLDSMEQLIHYKEKLQVKFGDKFSEEDEIVIVDVALVLDEEDDDDFSVNEAQTDPRWDGLQNISENN